MKTYEFSENNSGGSWWLERKHYDALRTAGWVEPAKNENSKLPDLGRILNTQDVPYEWRHGWTFKAASLREAVESWEAATNEDFFAEGCNCCGAPFSMHSTGDAKYESISGDSVDRTPIRPW